MWESGGWEPREDQLTWQQYEVAAAGGERERQGRQVASARRAPLITDRKASRQFLVKLSTLPWSEQRKIKAKLDQTLVVKKSRRSEKLVDPTIRQSGLPARLELRQVGKGIPTFCKEYLRTSLYRNLGLPSRLFPPLNSP